MRSLQISMLSLPWPMLAMLAMITCKLVICDMSGTCKRYPKTMQITCPAQTRLNLFQRLMGTPSCLSGNNLVPSFIFSEGGNLQILNQ